MPQLIINIADTEIDLIELRDKIQELLEEELPYITDGAIHNVQVLAEQPTIGP